MKADTATLTVKQLLAIISVVVGAMVFVGGVIWTLGKTAGKQEYQLGEFERAIHEIHDELRTMNRKLIGCCGVEVSAIMEERNGKTN